MTEKLYYLNLISQYNQHDIYHTKLIELMDKYNRQNLQEVTCEEVKEFWDMLNKR